jgi:hypothetical protein
MALERQKLFQIAEKTERRLASEVLRIDREIERLRQERVNIADLQLKARRMMDDLEAP